MNRTVTGNSKRFESHKTSSVAAIKRDTSEQDTKLLRWLYTSHFNSFLFLFPFLFLQTFPWHFFSMAMHLNFALFFFLPPEKKKRRKRWPSFYSKAYGNSGRLPCHHVSSALLSLHSPRSQVLIACAPGFCRFPRPHSVPVRVFQPPPHHHFTLCKPPYRTLFFRRVFQREFQRK